MGTIRKRHRNLRNNSFRNGGITHTDVRKTYTTGQIARLLDVSARTVTKMIDRGDLVGYRIPTSNDRRVCHDRLLEFLRAKRLPQYEQLHRASVDVVLFVGCGNLPAVCKGPWESYSASGAFDAGGMFERHSPELVVADAGSLGRSAALELGQLLARREPAPACVVLVPEDAQADQEYLKLFDEAVNLPADPAALSRLIATLLAEYRG